MRRKFFLKMIISSINRRKSRMFTALLAIAMGATILSGLVTIYYDIPRQLSREFRNYGANMIVLPTDANDKITDSDIEEIKSKMDKDKILGVAPFSYQTTKINEQPYIIAATDLTGLKANSPFWLVDGEWPSGEKEIMIGKSVSDNLGAGIGDKLTLNTAIKDREDLAVTDFVVKSIVTTGGKEEELIFMNKPDLESIIGPVETEVLEMSIDADSNTLKAYQEKINENQKLTVQLVKRVTESQDIVLNKLQALVWIVSLVVLVIMMICVSTTMMAVVSERRKEIGLKKALGAQNSSVIKDFLGEGFILGLMGGALGVIFGYLFANVVSVQVFARKVRFLYELLPVTIIVSIIITIVSCIIPVRNAAKVDPALVLRGE